MKELFKKHGITATIVLSVLALFINEALDPLGYQLTRVEAEVVEDRLEKPFALISTDQRVTVEQIKADRPECDRKFFVWGKVAISDTLRVEYDANPALPTPSGFVYFPPVEVPFNQRLEAFKVDLNRPLNDQIKERLQQIIHPGFDKSFTELNWVEVDVDKRCKKEEPQKPNK